MIDPVLSRLNIYMVPPVLSIVTGITLAVIAVVRGRFRSENAIFGLVVLWFTMMSPLFLLHHIFPGQFDLLLAIERKVHAFYVFLPFMVYLYVYKAFNFGKVWLLVVSFILCALISATTFTDLYLQGFYVYQWGYIAKGGIAFQAFGLYGTLTFIVFIVFFAWRFNRSTDPADRLKLRYIILSFLLVTFLTILNLPSMVGIDFYAFGNFIFIPLGILAYGVLKHRLMEIRSILHVTLMWATMSSVIAVPNVLIFYYFGGRLQELWWPAQFLVLVLWFYANYFYLRLIQPAIDQLFNRRKFNLRKIESEFIENISFLKSLDDLVREFIDITARTLGVRRVVVLYKKAPGATEFHDLRGETLTVEPSLEQWFVGANHMVERGLLAGSHYYAGVRDLLGELFDRYEAAALVPLVQNFELVGLLFLSEKYNLRQFNNHEIRFINNVRAAVAISIANSIMFQNLSDLKDTLEQRVQERTEELQGALSKIELTNRQLSSTNRQLEDTQRIASLDMTMAANVQAALFPKNPPDTDNWDVAFEFKPMSGVAGDLYDFYEKDGQLAGVSIFDVSGHGIASGLITMIARSVLHRQFYASAGEKLNTILERVNDELMDELGSVDNYLTGIMLRFDGDVVEYVNAGHPDMLFRRNDGSVRIVVQPGEDCKGPILGVRGFDLCFKTMKFRVQRREVLLLATDGLYESKNELGQDYGEKRIITMLGQAPDGTARQILDYLMLDFNHFTRKRNLEDDLTVIVLKRKI